MKEIKYKVNENIPLIDFLAKAIPTASRTKIKEILANETYVDGRKTTQYNLPLHPGMVVTLQKKTYKERFTPPHLDIIYEDPHLLVINKHEGLLSYSTKPSDQTVISILNQYLHLTHQKCHAHIVHRLDRDTSGLMIVSKSKQISQILEADWKGLVFDRAYVAVAWGNIEKDSGTIRSWLTDGPYCVLSSPIDNGGKEAITHYQVKRRSRRYSLLELRLDTGRRNQIRVHLREFQHPVVHDPLYGYKDDISPINRLALHAFRLCFTHPATGRPLRFETPYPPSFLRLLQL